MFKKNVMFFQLFSEISWLRNTKQFNNIKMEKSARKPCNRIASTFITTFTTIITLIIVLQHQHCEASHPGSVPLTKSLKDLVIGILVQDDEREKAYVHGALEFASASLQPDLQEIGYKLKFEMESSGATGCSELLSVGGAAKLLNTYKARAIIGPVCSDGCIPAGLVANYENSPIISYGCSSSSLSDPINYPTFARTKPYARTTPEYLGKTRISFQFIVFLAFSLYFLIFLRNVTCFFSMFL